MKNKSRLCIFLFVLLVILMTGCRTQKQEEMEATPVQQENEDDFPGFVPEGEKIDLPGIKVEDWDEEETTAPEIAKPDSGESGRPEPTTSSEYMGDNDLPGTKVENWDEDISEKTEPSNNSKEPESKQEAEHIETTPDNMTESPHELGDNETPGIAEGGGWD